MSLRARLISRGQLRSHIADQRSETAPEPISPVVLSHSHLLLLPRLEEA
jgi:hypothetical protein